MLADAAWHHTSIPLCVDAARTRENREGNVPWTDRVRMGVTDATRKPQNHVNADNEKRRWMPHEGVQWPDPWIFRNTKVQSLRKGWLCSLEPPIDALDK